MSIDTITGDATAVARAELVAGLRALADDIERATDAPLPTHVPMASWLIFGGTNQKETAAAVVRSYGGRWDKGIRQRNVYLDFVKDYGGGVRAEIVVDRPEVCERVVVDTVTVTIPASEAQVIEAQPERTETREIVEWRCTSLLADDTAEVTR